MVIYSLAGSPWRRFTRYFAARKISPPMKIRTWPGLARKASARSAHAIRGIFYRSPAIWACQTHSRAVNAAPHQSSAPIAQLVEHLICNQGVRGSSPCGGTIFHLHFNYIAQSRPSEILQTYLQQPNDIATETCA